MPNFIGKIDFIPRYLGLSSLMAYLSLFAVGLKMDSDAPDENASVIHECHDSSRPPLSLGAAAVDESQIGNFTLHFCFFVVNGFHLLNLRHLVDQSCNF